MGRSCSNSAFVPGVRFFLLIAADAGTMVVLIVELGPIAVGVVRGLGDCLGFGSFANGAGVGLYTFRNVGRLFGDNAVVPLVCLSDFLLAVLTDLRVVITVFFGPTIGGEAGTVVVRVQRELERLCSGLNGAFRICKQCTALGADVMRLHTLCHAGGGDFCHSVEYMLALRGFYGNGAVDKCEIDIVHIHIQNSIGDR